MKKVLFAMAIAGMFGFAACNNTKNAEEQPVADSTVEAVATECCEAAADSLTVECAAEAAEVATEVTE